MGMVLRVVVHGLVHPVRRTERCTQAISVSLMRTCPRIRPASLALTSVDNLDKHACSHLPFPPLHRSEGRDATTQRLKTEARLASCFVNAQGGLYCTNAVICTAEQVCMAPQQRLGTCNKHRAHAGMFTTVSASRELQGTPKIMAAATTLKAPSTYIGRLWTQPKTGHAAASRKNGNSYKAHSCVACHCLCRQDSRSRGFHLSRVFQAFAGADQITRANWSTWHDKGQEEARLT